jgi:hypothetical protein
MKCQMRRQWPHRPSRRVVRSSICYGDDTHWKEAFGGGGPGAEVEAAEPFGTDLDAGDDDVPGHSMNLGGIIR